MNFVHNKISLINILIRYGESPKQNLYYALLTTRIINYDLKRNGYFYYSIDFRFALHSVIIEIENAQIISCAQYSSSFSTLNFIVNIVYMLLTIQYTLISSSVYVVYSSYSELI